MAGIETMAHVHLPSVGYYLAFLFFIPDTSEMHFLP